MYPKVAKNTKTQFTRICIAQAIIDCLENDEFEKISVTSIVKRAGVARMTFYKHYDRPYDALIDYLNIVIEGYVVERAARQYSADMQYEHFLHALQYFDQYKDFFLILKRRNLYGIMIDGVNCFIETYVQERDRTAYERYFYAGGLLNTFIRWEESDDKMRPELVARSLESMYDSIFYHAGSDGNEGE